MLSQHKCVHFPVVDDILTLHYSSTLLHWELHYSAQKLRLDDIISLLPPLQGDPIGCRAGNGEKVSSSQAEPGQAINSAGAGYALEHDKIDK